MVTSLSLCSVVSECLSSATRPSLGWEVLLVSRGCLKKKEQRIFWGNCLSKPLLYRPLCSRPVCPSRMVLLQLKCNLKSYFLTVVSPQALPWARSPLAETPCIL